MFLWNLKRLLIILYDNLNKNTSCQHVVHDKLAASRLANESTFSRLRLGGLKRCFNLQFAAHHQPLAATTEDNKC